MMKDLLELAESLPPEVVARNLAGRSVDAGEQLVAIRADAPISSKFSPPLYPYPVPNLVQNSTSLR